MANSSREAFPHKVRIVRSSDYKALYKAGKKIHTQRFVLFTRENRLGHPRLGLTVSRKIGCAVVRNRIKRLFREIFRRTFNQIPGQYDIVVNAKSGCVGAGYDTLNAEFSAAVKKACH